MVPLCHGHSVYLVHDCTLPLVYLSFFDSNKPFPSLSTLFPILSFLLALNHSRYFFLGRPSKAVAPFILMQIWFISDI